MSSSTASALPLSPYRSSHLAQPFDLISGLCHTLGCQIGADVVATLLVAAVRCEPGRRRCNVLAIDLVEFANKSEAGGSAAAPLCRACVQHRYTCSIVCSQNGLSYDSVANTAFGGVSVAAPSLVRWYSIRALTVLVCVGTCNVGYAGHNGPPVPPQLSPPS